MTEDQSHLIQRKSEHIRINLEEDVQSGVSNGLEHFRFVHQALPDLNLEDIQTQISLFSKKLSAPILISAMTGGAQESERINQILAEAAQATGIAMGLGSQRVAIDLPKQAGSFKVRKYAPDILLFANLGAVQLNYGYTIDDCRRAVEIAEADGLVLHLNPLQEALQPEGNTRFAGLLSKIEGVSRSLTVPVIVKEVGWGISGEVARQLASVGVAAIDVAGAGGTSWSQVEKYRIQDARKSKIASAFRDWGISTADSICQVRQAAPDILIFASGGLRDGIDLAKCISLGAQLGGMAGPFLKTAMESLEETIHFIEDLTHIMRIAMFACGAGNIHQLQKTEMVKIQDAKPC